MNVKEKLLTKNKVLLYKNKKNPKGGVLSESFVWLRPKLKVRKYLFKFKSSA